MGVLLGVPLGVPRLMRVHMGVPRMVGVLWGSMGQYGGPLG